MCRVWSEQKIWISTRRARKCVRLNDLKELRCPMLGAIVDREGMVQGDLRFAGSQGGYAGTRRSPTQMTSSGSSPAPTTLVARHDDDALGRCSLRGQDRHARVGLPIWADAAANESVITRSKQICHRGLLFSCARAC